MKEIAIVFGILLTSLGLYGYLNPVEKNDTAAAEQAATADDAATVDTDSPATTEPQTKARSKTALIPALFGIPLMMCGTLGYLENLRKHAMHAAATIALLGGLMAGGRGLMKVSALFGDDPVAQRATTMVLIMAAICIVYVLLSVRSFIAARKAREAGEAAASA